MKKFFPDPESNIQPANQSGGALRKKDENIAASMLLTLARAGAYTESGEIKDVTGAVVPDTNVVKLVSYVCRHEPVVQGLYEFVTLLQKHGIQELPNENVSHVTVRRRNSSGISTARSPSPVTPGRLPSPLQSPSPEPISPRTIDGRNVPLPGRKRTRTWLSLDEPVSKRTRASKPKKA